MKENKRKISVVIPMKNAKTTIRGCVESVLRSDYPDFEVLVVDDASTDDSVAALSGLGCKIISLKENNGPGVARNEGVKSARGEIIAFTDADCEVPKDWLSNIAENFENYDIGALTGGYSRPLGTEPVTLFQFYDTAFRQRNVAEYVNSCITSNFACEKSIFEEIGGFPPLRINEDMEFGIALSRKYKILWDKNNGVAHRFNKNLGYYFFNQIRWTKAAALSYLSTPKAVLKENTWQNTEIYNHLLATFFLYLSFFVIFWNFNLIIIFIAAIYIYYIVNRKFIAFVTNKEKGISFLNTLSLIFIRNTSWLLGIAGAIPAYISMRLKRLKT